MSDLELLDAVALKTGEDSHEIRRRGFVLTGPDDAGLEPECLLGVLLVDLPQADCASDRRQFYLRRRRSKHPPETTPATVAAHVGGSGTASDVGVLYGPAS